MLMKKDLMNMGEDHPSAEFSCKISDYPPTLLYVYQFFKRDTHICVTLLFVKYLHKCRCDMQGLGF